MSQSQLRTNKRQSVTIKEVAERAGVSLMTVSRVLNKQSVVKEETRLKVEQAMRDLNYRPNMLARGLAGGNSIFIGMIHANPSGGYLSEFLVGALNSCREAGHHLVLEDLSFDGKDFDKEDVLARLRSIGLDGIIVTPPLSENPVVVEAMRALDLPFVRIAEVDSDSNDYSVAIHDSAAAGAMTDYLIDCGHREIGFVVGAPNQTSSHRRLAGFRKAMAAHGIDIGENNIVEGDFTYRSGMTAAETLLSRETPPTAIFASNDDMAAGVLASAHRLGFRIPQDLSVVGFDDTPIATAIWPQLTTMRQPIADMAHKAVGMLSATVSPNGDGPVEQHQVLDVSIIERDTVGPPRG